MPKKFECIITPKTSNTYNICIWDNIDGFEEYDELNKQLNRVTENDRVILYVATSGGRCDVGFMLIDRFAGLPCPVEVIVPYPTYSMGALMALCGDSLHIYEGSFLMFHDYSGGGGRAKGNETLKATEAYNEVFAHRFNVICQPFLTKKECADVLNGKDLYIKWNDPTLEARIKRHFK